MIPKESEAEILRLYYAERWLVGTIATQLKLHHSVVRRVIAQEGTIHALPARRRLVDPYLSLITETLQQYPTLSASRIHEMVRQRGYPGKISQFRSVVAELRPRGYREPFFRLKTLPGEQAQVDWGHFGQLQCGKAHRPLMAFVIVLSHSRAIFLRFFLSQSLSNFLYGHRLAFEWFGGVSRVCLYDNLKSVVVERIGNAIRFNSQFTQFAGHYRFEPRPVAVARGNEKGRTERAIRYIRTNFFAARKFSDLDDLNRQALAWCETTAFDRQWRDDISRTVGEIFLEEKKVLLSLPGDPFSCEERKEVSIGKTPYARFDLNDYSVPAEMVQRSVVVLASTDSVRILDGLQVIASHQRSYDRGRTIEEASHLEHLKGIKREAGQHRRTHLLAEVVPASTELLRQVAERNMPLGNASAQLKDLLDTYGAVTLESAIKEALANNAPHPHAVRHILERIRQEAGQAPALPLPFCDDPRLRTVSIKPHSLTSYDNLLEDPKDD